MRINGDILDLQRDAPDDVCGFGTNGADAVLNDGSVSTVGIDYRYDVAGLYASRVSPVRIDYRNVATGLYASRVSPVRIDDRYVAAGLYGDRMSSVRIDDHSMLCICGQTQKTQKI